MKTYLTHFTSRTVIQQYIPLIVAACILISTGCNSLFSSSEDGSPIVAKYKEAELTLNRLRHYIPEGATPEDSARYADYYIEQWLKEQAVADVALNKIGDLEQKIDFKVADYRQKLILHEYAAQFMADKLDTNVARRDIVAYFNKHSDKLTSKENLYCYFYVISLRSESSSINISSLMNSDDPQDLRTLEEWARVNSIEYKLDSGFVNDFEMNRIQKGYAGNLRSIPEGQVKQWSGAKKGKYIKYYYKKIDYLEPGDQLPLSLTKAKIKNTILNERKIKLIEDEEEKIMKDARLHNHIKQVNF